jgi:nucleotide-binding universal stress UspA family protein
LDGSELAEAILVHVEELAKLYGSTVILLQVFELPHMVGLPRSADYNALPEITPAEVNQQFTEAHRYLDGIVSSLVNKGIKARGKIEYGPVVASIMRIARQEDASLIAMASHGRGGLSDVYYGSVAAGVLQRIDRPLLIVRAGNSTSR